MRDQRALFGLRHLQGKYDVRPAQRRARFRGDLRSGGREIGIRDGRVEAGFGFDRDVRPAGSDSSPVSGVAATRVCKSAPKWDPTPNEISEKVSVYRTRSGGGHFGADLHSQGGVVCIVRRSPSFGFGSSFSRARKAE